MTNHTGYDNLSVSVNGNTGLSYTHGAVAEKLGSGLQNRVHRCESGPRLHFYCVKGRASGGTGRRKGLKIPRVNNLCGFDSHLAHHGKEEVL